MPPIPFADNFLAGSIISLLFPILLLIAIVAWYLIAVKHLGNRPPAREVPADRPPQAGPEPPRSGS
jgi:hypothetical protein